MAAKEELSGLENLLIYNELSAEEYFSIVVSSSDLDIAKTSIANVITKLRQCNGGDHAKLQDLYEDFFQTPVAEIKESNPNPRSGPKPPSQTHHATPKQHLKKAWGVNPTTIKGPKPPSEVQSGSSNKPDQNFKSTTSGVSESGECSEVNICVVQCTQCSETFKSRNELFRHLKSTGHVNEQEAKSPKLPSGEQINHIENQRSEEDNSSLKQNSYGDYYIQSQDSGNGTTEDKNNVTESNSNSKKKKKKKKKGGSNSDEPAPVILWFRRDLRLYDNPALVRAAFDDNGNDRPVIPVFIWNDMEEKERMNSGGAVKVWLHRALEELSFSLDKHYDSRLILRHHSDTNIGMLPIVQFYI